MSAGGVTRTRRRARWRRLLLVAIGAVVGGWMLVDGARAFVVGDYVTPAAGEHAGQLGPWASLVDALGLDPRSAPVKALHIACGALWLGAAGAVAAGRSAARTAVTLAAIASSWYLPFGTLGGVIALVLVFTDGSAEAMGSR